MFAIVVHVFFLLMKKKTQKCFFITSYYIFKKSSSSVWIFSSWFFFSGSEASARFENQCFRCDKKKQEKNLKTHLGCFYSGNQQSWMCELHVYDLHKLNGVPRKSLKQPAYNPSLNTHTYILNIHITFGFKLPTMNVTLNTVFRLSYFLMRVT